MKELVLHVTDNLVIGGSQRILTELSIALSTNGQYQQVVLCLYTGGPFEDQLRQAGIPVYFFEPRIRSRFSRLIASIQIMRMLRPNVVQTYRFSANTYGRIAAIISRVPVILAVEHGLDEWKQWPALLLDRVLAQLTNGIIVDTLFLENLLVKKRGIPSSKIIRIREGINLEKFAKLKNIQRDARKGKKLTIGVMARLIPIKGVQYLLDAARLLKERGIDIHILVGSEGPYREELERITERNALSEDVEFLGFVPDAVSMFPLIDLFVLPSLSETIPQVILEAMAAGVPCIGTRVGGVPELIIDGVTGLLVPPSDSVALADAIQKLLTDKRLAQSMTDAAKVIVNEYSMSYIAEEHELLYRNLLKKNASV